MNAFNELIRSSIIDKTNIFQIIFEYENRFRTLSETWINRVLIELHQMAIESSESTKKLKSAHTNILFQFWCQTI